MNLDYRNLSYLLDIYQYGQDALNFVQGMDELRFSTDVKTQRAIEPLLPTENENLEQDL